MQLMIVPGNVCLKALTLPRAKVAYDKGGENEFVQKPLRILLGDYFLEFHSIFAFAVVPLNFGPLVPPQVLLSDQRQHPELSRAHPQVRSQLVEQLQLVTSSVFEVIRKEAFAACSILLGVFG